MDLASTPRHPVGLVAQRTGLSPHVLRAWERRFGVVAPGRSNGGQRLYSDEDLEHLSLLARLTDAGRPIGQVATLTIAELRELAAEDLAHRPAVPAGGARAGEMVERSLEAIRSFRADELQGILRRAAILLTVPVALDEVFVPVLHQIGEDWQAGTITPAHEHMATSVVRRTLGWIIETAAPPAGAPALVVATPPRERHELGAKLVAAAAAAEGWRVLYLGTDLPIPDLAAAANGSDASAVALSVIHPVDREELLGHLRTLRSRLAPGVPVLLGGAAAVKLAAKLDDPGVEILGDLADLRTRLQQLRPGG